MGHIDICRHIKGWIRKIFKELVGRASRPVLETNFAMCSFSTHYAAICPVGERLAYSDIVTPDGLDAFLTRRLNLYDQAMHRASRDNFLRQRNTDKKLIRVCLNQLHFEYIIATSNVSLTSSFEMFELSLGRVGRTKAGQI